MFLITYHNSSLVCFSFISYIDRSFPLTFVAETTTITWGAGKGRNSSNASESATRRPNYAATRVW